jgi:hypothetical protein
MKKILLAVCLMFGGASLVVAQDQSTTPSQTQTTTQDQDQEKQQIAVSELPDAVSAKLESQDFSGWTVGNAYKKMDESNQEMYIVELKQGTETKKVKFDRDGNEIEKGKHDKADNSNYRDAESTESTPADPSATEESAPDQSATDESSTESTETEQSTTDQADNSSTETEQQ